MKSVKELLLWAESGFGGKSAIVDIDRGVRWTYAELNAAARSICASYASGGVRRDDRVGWLVMAPGADVTALSFGARKMGAIPVAMNGRAAPEQIAWMINNVGLKALSYTAETVELLERVRAIGIPSVTHFIAVDEPVSDGHASLKSVYSDYADADEPAVPVAADDVALVVYTSGSTGRPKPVMHSEASWLETTMVGAYASGLYHADRYLTIMPPHFVGWAHVVGAALRSGATQVAMRFSPETMVRAIVDERCTHVIMTPTMVRMLREVVDRGSETFQRNNVRIVQLGGELATDEVLDTLHALFPKAQRIASHGATEAVSLTTGVANPDLGTDGRLLGKPVPGAVVEVRDEETGAVITKPGVPGVLFVKGPVAVGVWGDEEATAKNFPDGWWRSGDVVERDEDGNLLITGRSDNMFKSGAIKVQCEDVETILKAHPRILDAVVVPVPDARFGMVPHAFVRHTEALTADELETWWRSRDDAPPYARPRHWTFWGVESFPMATAVKVDRQGLRRKAAQQLTA